MGAHACSSASHQSPAHLCGAFSGERCDARWKNGPTMSAKNAERDGRKIQAGVHFKEMVPRGGLQESRFIKGLAGGGTLKLLPAFFSFPHHGVPPKRLTIKLYERLPL